MQYEINIQLCSICAITPPALNPWHRVCVIGCILTPSVYMLMVLILQCAIHVFLINSGKLREPQTRWIWFPTKYSVYKRSKCLKSNHTFKEERCLHFMMKAKPRIHVTGNTLSIWQICICKFPLGFFERKWNEANLSAFPGLRSEPL